MTAAAGGVALKGLTAAGGTGEIVDVVASDSGEVVSAVQPCPLAGAGSSGASSADGLLKFDTVADSNTWADANMHPDDLDLTPAEKNALTTYQVDSAPINGELRGGESLTDGTARSVENLDSAIDQSKLPRSVQTYRGINRELVENLQPGDYDFDPGYMSTSFVEDTAHTFGDATMELTVPADSNGLYMDNLDGLHSQESELLLPRDTQFQILSREERDGRLYLKGAVLP